MAESECRPCWSAGFPEFSLEADSGLCLFWDYSLSQLRVPVNRLEVISAASLVHLSQLQEGFPQGSSSLPSHQGPDPPPLEWCELQLGALEWG